MGVYGDAKGSHGFAMKILMASRTCVPWHGRLSLPWYRTPMGVPWHCHSTLMGRDWTDMEATQPCRDHPPKCQSGAMGVLPRPIGVMNPHECSWPPRQCHGSALFSGGVARMAWWPRPWQCVTPTTCRMTRQK